MPSGLVPSVTFVRSGQPSASRSTPTPDTSQLTVTVAMTITGEAALRAADEVKDRLWQVATCLPPGASVVNVATTVASVHTDEVAQMPGSILPVPTIGPLEPATGQAPVRDLTPGSDRAATPDQVPLRMFPVSRIAALDEAPVRLTRREFDLLLHLARNPGRVFTRQQLSLAVWQEDFMRGERTIDVHIHRLRLKLAGRGPVITTVRGIGYRLDAAHRVWVASETT